MKCYYGLYISYESLENYSESINAYREFLNIDTQTLPADSASVINRLLRKSSEQQVKYEKREKGSLEKEISLLVIGAFLLILLILLAFRNSHNRKKLENERLLRQNAENKMENERLLRQNAENKVEKERLLRQNAENKMAALFSQIKAHFILNVIGSILGFITKNN